MPATKGDVHKISEECLRGVGHFNRCPKLDCPCICHKMDGEAGVERIKDKR